jgi:lipoprotein-releasing system permease protein
VTTDPVDATRGAGVTSSSPPPPSELAKQPPTRREGGVDRDVRFGWTAPVFVLLAAAYLVATGLLIGLAPGLMFLVGVERSLGVTGAAVAGGLQLPLIVFGIITLVRVLRLQPGTRGRTRLLILIATTPIGSTVVLSLLAMIAVSLVDGQLNHLSQTVPFAEWLLGLNPVGTVVFWALVPVAVLLEGIAIVTLLTCWFLVPESIRRVCWTTFDVVLTTYLLAVVLTHLLFELSVLEPLFVHETVLPMRAFAPLLGLTVLAVLPRLFVSSESLWPVLAAWLGRVAMLVAIGAALLVLDFNVPEDAPERLIPAIVQLVAVVLLGLRAHARWVPTIIDTIELISFHSIVAARHLRTRKSDFLATIGILSIAAVCVSSCALTTTLSVMGGFRDDLKKKILGNNAHIVVDQEHKTFGEWEPLLAEARRTDHVIGAAPYVSGEVMVTSASNLASAVLRGIDPASIDDVIDLRSNLTRGRIEYLDAPERLLDLPPEDARGPFPLELPAFERRADPPPDPSPPDSGALDIFDSMLEHVPDPTAAQPMENVLGPDPAQPARELLPGVIVGQELARSLRLYVGDEINVISPHGDLGPTGPMPKSRPFRVAGIFYSGMYEYDLKYMYVTLPTAQRFLNIGDHISGIEVKTDDVERAPAVANALRTQLAREDIRVRDWQELNRNLFGALELEKLAMFIALGLAILVAGFCVFGTLTLMVQEKSREVGILKAMGTTQRAIVIVFLIEGLLIGVFGAELGIGLGYIMCFAFEHFGVRMNPEVYYIDRLPVHVDGTELALVGIAAVGMCLLATIFPAVLASRMRPVDALRYE